MERRFAVEGADVLFAHWPVPASRLRDRLPDGLAVDTHDGDAWVTVLPHRIVGLRLGGRRLPVTFPQLNVRTYVRRGDKTGVFFLGCETGNRLGAVVARRGFGVPFHRAEMCFTESGGRFTVRSRRSLAGGDVRFDVRYRPTGEATPADQGSLAAFLVERTRWYVPGPGSSLRVGEIDREPWRLAPVEASLRADTLDAAFDLPLNGEPTLHYSPGYAMDVTPPRRVEP
jgi:uncharacterized protein YqjF (DUF2071 family)